MEANKVWNKDAIKTLLVENDKAAIKALVTIYGFQTQSEQSSEQTTEANKQGFTAFDAEILTSFAQFYQRTGFLTPKQMEMTKKRIVKYWKQLLKVVESQGRQVSYK